jgi:hypothetical protein
MSQFSKLAYWFPEKSTDKEPVSFSRRRGVRKRGRLFAERVGLGATIRTHSEFGSSRLKGSLGFIANPLPIPTFCLNQSVINRVLQMSYFDTTSYQTLTYT